MITTHDASCYHMNVLSTEPLKIYCNLGKIQVQNCSFNIAQGEGEAKNLEQKNVSYLWDQVCWFVFDASWIPPDQKCRELSVGSYSIHDNAVLCFQWILQGDGIQRHNRWRQGEKSEGGLGLVDPNSFPFFIRHYNSAVYYFVLFYQLNA